MIKVAIVSGKGGTGKTTFAAIIHSIEGCVIADCDVDAPNLHILLKPKIVKKEDFIATEKAFITDKCDGCGLCYKLCRFDAIKKENNSYSVDEQRCEGCAFCYHICQQKAIEMRKTKTGEIYISKTEFGYMCHAQLKPGEENSGKLVSEVRKRADEIAEKEGFDFEIIDSPPGIGCPVMASLTGVNCALIVTEPTFSGLSDLKRIAELCNHFKIKTFSIVNRFDLNKEMASKIENFCKNEGIEFLGNIPFSKEIIEQTAQLKFPFKGETAKKIAECWNKMKEKL